MPSGTDYAQEYGQAEKAYLQGNYETAATIIDRMVKEYPEDPNILLLRGHIYSYGLQEYNLAQEQYEKVLELTDDPDCLDYAHNGLQQLNQLKTQDQEDILGNDDNEETQMIFNNDEDENSWIDNEELEMDWDNSDSPSEDNWDSNNPFDLNDSNSIEDDDSLNSNNPFAMDDEPESPSMENEWLSIEEEDFNQPYFLDISADENSVEQSYFNETNNDNEEMTLMVDASENLYTDSSSENSQFTNDNDIDDSSLSISEEDFDKISEKIASNKDFYEDEDYELEDISINSFNLEDDTFTDKMSSSKSWEVSSSEKDETFLMPNQNFHNLDNDSDSDFETIGGKNKFNYEFNGSSPETLDEFDKFDDSEISDEFMTSLDDQSDSFLDEFDVFDDDKLDNLPTFDMADMDESIPDSGIFSASIDTTDSFGLDNTDFSNVDHGEEAFGLNNNSANVATNFTSNAEQSIEATTEVEQGFLAFFENSSIQKKQWMTAGASAIAAMTMTAFVTFLSASSLISNSEVSTETQKSFVWHLQKTGLAMILFSGAASFSTALFLNKKNQSSNTTYNFRSTSSI